LFWDATSKPKVLRAGCRTDGPLLVASCSSWGGIPAGVRGTCRASVRDGCLFSHDRALGGHYDGRSHRRIAPTKRADRSTETAVRERRRQKARADRPGRRGR
jgi:hypothetical protein